MCGRYASSRRPEDLVEEFEIDTPPAVGGPPPDWNVAPTDPVWAVRERRREPDDEPVRRLESVRWGLVPSWSEKPAGGAKMINARMETVATKPAFRRAFAMRRIILPADGWYEWYQTESGAKQPFFLRDPEGSILGFAGIEEVWRDRSKPDDDPDAWLRTCAVITRTAVDALGHIHDRMPVLVRRDDRRVWLHPGTPVEVARRLLDVPPPPIAAHPVSKAVNDVRADGPDLVEPLAFEEQAVLF